MEPSPLKPHYHYPTQALELNYWPLYDTAIFHKGYAERNQNRISFFQTAIGNSRDYDPSFGLKDSLDTNMWLGGALPTPRSMLIHGIILVPELRKVPREVWWLVREFIEEFVRPASTVGLEIGNKIYMKMPTSCIMPNMILLPDDIERLEQAVGKNDDETYTLIEAASKLYDPRRMVPLDSAFRLALLDDDIDTCGDECTLRYRGRKANYPLHLPTNTLISAWIDFPDGVPLPPCVFAIKCYITGIQKRECW